MRDFLGRAACLLICFHMYLSTSSAQSIITTYAGDGTSNQLNSPYSVAVDQAGSLYITDTLNYRIRKLTTNGTISTAAAGGLLRIPINIAVDAAGNIFATDTLAISNFTFTDTLTNRVLSIGTNGQMGLVGDRRNWYFFDYDASPLGEVCVTGIATDLEGNIYVSETVNHAVWKITPTGNVIRVAGLGGEIWGFGGDGGPATSASLSYPNGLAVDKAGNLFIADSGNNRIRKVSPAGIITTVAGNGLIGFSGDGGSAVSAQIWYPLAVAVDSDGNLYIADSHNSRIRMVNAAGIIFTVAGNGTSGFSGDFGPPSAAQIAYPTGVAVDGSGNLFIADALNNRIRKVNLGGPVLSGMSVASGLLGTSFSVTLTGNGFSTGLMTIDALPGITFSNVTVVDSNTMKADFTIATDTSTGPRNITVTRFPGGTSAAATFMINTLTTPSLTGISPASGGRGESVTVTLAGSGFISGMTVNPGSGIISSNVSVRTPALATATFTIAPDALAEARLVTVSTNLGTTIPVTFAVTPPQLMIRKYGSGSGTVTSSPAGIHCGDTCSTPFVNGQNFVLTASPADGSVFSGWGGDADCIDGSVTMSSSRSCTARFDLPQSNSTSLRGDFDGDGKADIAVFRPSTGEWFLRLSTQGYTFGGGSWYFQWGLPGDLPVTGDYDGDGRTDIAVYRPSSGEWFLRLSRQNYAIGAGSWYFQWGLIGDVPVIGDFDGDLKSDIAVYRPSSGEWFLRLSRQNYAFGAGSWYFQWGLAGDVPIVGDFDGDLKAEIGVYRPSSGEWLLRLSTQNYAFGAGSWYFQWGLNEDQPVLADFDGDGKTDIAVYRPPTEEWFLKLSTQNYRLGAGNWYFQWGQAGDQRIVGDFDGDGKSDLGTYQSSLGQWILRKSTLNYNYGVVNSYFQWGIKNDLPLPR